MIILNIETSTDACSAAITENGRVMTAGSEHLCRLEPEKSEHARQLALFVDELLGKLREEGKSIDAVAVSAGPGSYTGLRIGASMAKGLAYGLNVPMVAVPTLSILQTAHRCDSADTPLIHRCAIRPMLDARRMEVYTQLFDTDGKAQTEVEAKVVDADSFADELAAGKVVFTGNGAMKCQSVLSHENAIFEERVPDAAYMGELAEELLARGEKVDVAYWTPFYLKEFEAKKSVVKGLH